MAETIDTRCRELLDISDKAFQAKRRYDALNQEIAELFHPIRADFTGDVDYANFAPTVMDGSTVLSRETLGNAIKSMLRQGDWFEVGTGDERRDKETRNARALKWATRQLMAIIRDPRVQFDVATDEADHDWVAFGQPVLSWEASADRTHLVLKAHHPRDNAWSQNADGLIDCNYRDVTMTARQIMEMFERKRWNGTPHVSVQQAAKDEPSKEIKIRHILMPTEGIYGSDYAKMHEIRHPFISIYIDMGNKTYLHERGAPVFNYVIPRWKRVGKAGWGYSPVAVNALGDARMLQSMALTIMEQGERAVSPPTVASAEIFTRDWNNVPDGLTLVDMPEGAKLGDVMTQLQTGEGLRMGHELKQDVRALVAEAWLLNRLFLPNLRDMRELEVAVRTEEFRRAALPFFSPIDGQYHHKVLETGFEMSMHLGMIPTEAFPDDLLDRDVKFTFNSPLNEAEGMKTVQAFRTAVEVLTIGNTIDPTINNMLDFRKGTRDAIRGIPGSDPDWLLSDIQMRAKDEQATMVKNLQQATAIAQGGAGAVSDVSNAMIAGRNAGLLPAPQAAA